MTKYNFSPMLKEVFDLTMKKETIVNGFKRCGISPLDRNSVDYSKVDICNNELPKQKEDLVKDAKVRGKYSWNKPVDKAVLISWSPLFLLKCYNNSRPHTVSLHLFGEGKKAVMICTLYGRRLKIDL